jgi:hypothetical protein
MLNYKDCNSLNKNLKEREILKLFAYIGAKEVVGELSLN